MTEPTAISLRDETRCAAPGCSSTIIRAPRGRPALYCSPACRTAAHRKHRCPDPAGPLTVEIDHGSTSAKGRPAGRVWLVRLRRGNRAVVIASGLGRPSADNLAHQITQLLQPPHQRKQTRSSRPTPLSAAGNSVNTSPGNHGLVDKKCR